MEFLKQMKKREYIEMALKTAIAMILGIIVIFFMEAMIYKIYIRAIDKNPESTGNLGVAEWYIKENKDDSYDVYLHYNSKNGNWSLKYNDLTKEKLDEKLAAPGPMLGYNARLYKIEVSDSTIYINDSNDGSAYAQVKAAYEDNHESKTFSIFTKALETDEFGTTATNADLTYDELLELFKDPGEFVKYTTAKVFWRVPNCFDIYMNGAHYAVMALFLVIIAGVYVWRFVLIAKEYKKIENRFKKTGKLF